MSNLLDLFYFAGDRVDYVVVHNPAKVRTNLFKKSNIEAELKKFGAKELTLPVVTSITLLAIKRAEAKGVRKLSFAEVATPGASHLELMLAGEMQWAMQQMFRQYDAIADLLVPLEQVPEVEPQPELEEEPTVEAHVGLHARQQHPGIFIRFIQLPMDMGVGDLPLAGEFTLEKVEDKVLKQLRQRVPEKITEASRPAVLRREPVLVDELTDVQQKGIDAVVAVELDAPEMFALKFQPLNGGEPA
jgi:hypothetical protein